MKVSHLILSCIFICSPAASQYVANTELRPDVTFGDHNDRYDITNFVDYQNRYFRTDDSQDFRRRFKAKTKHKSLRSDFGFPGNEAYKYALLSRKGRKKLAKRIKKETEKQINNLANEILLRMNNPDMRRIGRDVIDLDEDGGDIYDFNENLAKFRGGKRRLEEQETPDKVRKGNASKNESYRRQGEAPGNPEGIKYRRMGTALDKLKHIGYRRMEPSQELFHYAFPIDMKVQGYLLAPDD